jgi:hypothetical protein
MAYEVKMGEDGILRLSFVGFIDRDDMEGYTKEYMAFVRERAEDEPVHAIVDASRMGKMSSAARKMSIETFSNPDPRVGKTAIVGASRYLRVLTGFILKAIGRENIRLVATEEEGLEWLSTAE